MNLSTQKVDDTFVLEIISWFSFFSKETFMLKIELFFENCLVGWLCDVRVRNKKGKNVH